MCYNFTNPKRYSDLLLHNMGPGLADQVQQGSALGKEFRTIRGILLLPALNSEYRL
jgi:CxxC motif-containing protein (DUF1111 family)